MAKARKSEKVSKKMQPTHDAIATLTDKFCDEYLNAEYAQLARQMTAALCRKRPSPLERGRQDVWACGIVYALGSVNFLFHQSQEPSMSSIDLCQRFGVNKRTGEAKSKVVRDLLNIKWLDLNWWLPSRLDVHPTAWFVQVNDMIVDARHMPREIQEICVEKGLIPYLPGGPEIVTVNILNLPLSPDDA